MSGAALDVAVGRGVLGAVFVAPALGDFRLIGFFEQAWHDDPDYAPLKQLRHANVDMEVFIVERA